MPKRTGEGFRVKMDENKVGKCGRKEQLSIIAEQQKEIASLRGVLEQKATLVRMMIHDLKGPLSNIMANLDLLSMNSLKDQERECVQTALMGCQDLFHMVQNLLEIGKMEQGQIELNLSVVQPEELFSDIVRKMKTLSEQKGVMLRIDCRSGIRSLPVDANLLERILSNLVLNALKYSPLGGEITLSTEDGSEMGKIVLAVSDQGIGIPIEFQEIIFDPYGQVDCTQGTRTRMTRSEGNVGLGLAFCRLAVEQHGGKIWVRSSPGQGSTFFVELPTDLIPLGSGLM